MKPINTSTCDFPTLIQDGFVYVDKTRQIYELARRDTDGIDFFPRPQRFGKSLLISTLKALFKGRRELFKGLAIENTDWDWEHELYPVLHLDMSKASCSNAAELEERLSKMMKSQFDHFGLECDDTASASGNFITLPDSLPKIAQNGRKGWWSRKPKRGEDPISGKYVVLIDEYDSPIAGLLDSPKRRDALDDVRKALHDFYVVSKANCSDMRFLMVTGVSKFAKTSIFSAFNNPTDLSLNARAADLVSYTHEELETYFHAHIQAFADERGRTCDQMFAKLLAWYDSYQFSPDNLVKVVNPVSLGRALSEHKLIGWWEATASSTLVFDALKEANQAPVDFAAKFSTSTLDAPDALDAPAAALLYQGGYLTIDKPVSDRMVLLKIPNYELRESVERGYVSRLLGKDFELDAMLDTAEETAAKLASEGYTETFKTMLQSAYSRLPHDWLFHDEKEVKQYFLSFMVFANAEVVGEEQHATGPSRRDSPHGEGRLHLRVQVRQVRRQGPEAVPRPQQCGGLYLRSTSRLLHWRQLQSRRQRPHDGRHSLRAGIVIFLVSHAFSENELMTEDIHNRILFDDIAFNEGMPTENVAAQMLTAAGNKLFFFSRHDRRNPFPGRGCRFRHCRVKYSSVWSLEQMKRSKMAMKLAVVVGSALSLAAAGAAEVPLSGDGWTCDGAPVAVPHTWNAIDGADGLGVPKGRSGHNAARSPSYARAVKTYRRALPAPKAGKRYFLKFDGACEKTAVRVNGREVGRHVGAFAGFVFEITEELGNRKKEIGKRKEEIGKRKEEIGKRKEENILEVEVDNRIDRSVPPYEADFTMFGGLYRDVTLIEKPRVCIDPRVPLAVTADPKTGRAEVAYTISDGAAVGGDHRAPRHSTSVKSPFEFGKPELWSPENPKCYEATVRAGEDAETVRFGFRTVEFRADGFYLNGVRRQLRGVCLHQDHGAKGWATDAADEEADVKALKELGADAVRTSHYPRSPRFYDLCDRHGILVWTELPLVDEVPGTNAVFEANALKMAEEMVTAHRNHPSIFAWGIFNEVYQFRKPDGSSERVLRKVRDRIHALDPSRPAGGASNGRKIELNAVPDILGMNLYPGWYGTSVDMMDTCVEEACRDNRRTSVAVTEYGAGGSVKQHGDAKARPKPASFWHPEEYQAYFHARTYRYLKDNPRVWGTFVWQMFDAASDSRQEGDHAGINDKGLVTRDRLTKKDAWYLYHANWSKDPVLHIAGTRWGKTDRGGINVLTFCNVGHATLTVNGRKFDDRDPDPANVILWEEVPLKVGANEIVLTAGGLTRTLKIERKPALAPFPAWSEPRRITSGPHEHFLASYFAIDSWSPDNRYVSVLETDVNGRLPEAGERCTLGLVDLEDGNRFIPIATTACWNFQEAAMAHWLSDDELIFNDCRNGKFVAVILNWKTKAERILPMPVSAVSEDKTWAVSINYARLSLLRPDYGYAGDGQDPRETVPWPTDDGLWTMDLKSGETKLILSVADTRSQMPQPQAALGKPGQPLAYHCHTVISKDGAKIFFLARSVDWFDKVTHEIPYWQTTSFTVDRDGKNLRRCFKDGWAGSHFNWAPDGSHKMLVTATWNESGDPKLAGRAWSPVEFEVGRESEVRRIGAGVLDLDWHCVYSPDGQFMSGETYWNKYFQRPWVLVRLADGMTMPMGTFFVPEAYRGGYWRCDLHARYRRDGRQIGFNSVHEGTRQVYVREITPPAK